MVKTAKEPLEQRKYQEPEEEYCKAPELHANALGASSPCNISIKGSRANALVRQGEIEEAEKIYQEILDLSTEALGEVHPHRLSCRSNLARILEKRGSMQRQKQFIETCGSFDGERSRTTILIPSQVTTNLPTH
jgi:pentatricopeptide repeat protein